MHWRGVKVLAVMMAESTTHRQGNIRTLTAVFAVTSFQFVVGCSVSATC
jgi:hypothetical protein